MRRRDLYGREQLLAKIRGETERAHELLDARSSLQEQRKLANMGASFQRQKLMQARPLTSALCCRGTQNTPICTDWVSIFLASSKEGHCVA